MKRKTNAKRVLNMMQGNEEEDAFISSMMTKEEYFDSSEDDRDLEEHLASLRGEYLTEKLPRGHPLQPNEREKNSKGLKKVRDDLRKEYIKKVTALESGLLKSNVK